MSKLRVTLCQVDIEWEAIDANLKHYADLLSDLKGTTDLIILPETFTTGFSMDAPELTETMDGTTVSWLKEQALKLDASVLGSFLYKEDQKMYNRFIWVRPDGSVSHYDKRHLFSFAQEDKHFSVGTERKIINHEDWRVMPQVCYDLRFPVWSRNRKEDRYDVLLYVANWPAVRSFVWRNLLEARAHENQCFVVGVNRIGKDANGIAYDGNSMVISPKGEVIASFGEGEEGIVTVELDKVELDDFRSKFRPLDDADVFDIIG